MSDLETFRAETRAWLEANCPPEMRQPMKDESDACWGGRNPVFKSEAQKVWLCGCKSTKAQPFCDGSHKTLPAEPG